jgi:septum formation protein
VDAPLVLASRSPRRAALLAAAGIPCEVRVFPPVDETPAPALHEPRAIVRELAERKARAAAGRAPGARVLAADTLVFLDGRILGKPADAAEARRMLADLSGREHLVATGVALAVREAHGVLRVRSGAEVTRLRFRGLGPEEIEAYVAGGEPLDKAGAYALQGEAAAFVTACEGARDTVVGLPVALVRKLLADS